MDTFKNTILISVIFALSARCGDNQPASDTRKSPSVTGQHQQVATASTSRVGEEWIFSKPAGVFFTKAEITLGQYKKCVADGACEKKNHRTKSENNHCNWGYSDRDDHPMVCVNFFGAEQFCKWLHKSGRLPKSEEWIAEATADEGRDWPWGNTPRVNCEYAIWGDGNNTTGCGKERTWPGCSRPKGNSVSGLCDMIGNVSEWTGTLSDRTGSGYYEIYGYSWMDVRIYNGTSFPLDEDPYYPEDATGFRCVR